MADYSWNALAEQVKGQVFPGRDELLDWFARHPNVRVHHADVPDEDSTTATDARRIWEIRAGSTRRGGLQTGYMEDAVKVLRQVEQTTPDQPIVVRSAAAEDRHWFLLSASGRFLAAFWVERRAPPSNICRLCARQLPPATVDYAVARVRDLAEGRVVDTAACDGVARDLREGMLALADELEGLCSDCRKDRR